MSAQSRQSRLASRPLLPVSGANAHVVVVVPAYNEEDRIAEVLRGLHSHCCRVIVVDDGSSDATAYVAKEHGATVLHHVINRGQGAALQTGIDFALSVGADVIVTMDADGQHRPGDLAALLAPIVRSECDVTLGSRFLGSSHEIPWYRRWLLRLAVRFTRWTVRMPVTDTHNGLRAFSRLSAERLEITQDRMAHATEILEQIRAHCWSYREVPVNVRYNTETLAKGQGATDALWILWDLILGRCLRRRMRKSAGSLAGSKRR